MERRGGREGGDSHTETRGGEVGKEETYRKEKERGGREGGDSHTETRRGRDKIVVERQGKEEIR